MFVTCVSTKQIPHCDVNGFLFQNNAFKRIVCNVCIIMEKDNERCDLILQAMRDYSMQANSSTDNN